MSELDSRDQNRAFYVNLAATVAGHYTGKLVGIAQGTIIGVAATIDDSIKLDIDRPEEDMHTTVAAGLVLAGHGLMAVIRAPGELRDAWNQAHLGPSDV